MMDIEISDFSRDVFCHNADEFCVERKCSNVFTKYYDLKIGKMQFHLPVCNKHDDLIGDMTWKNLKNQQSPKNNSENFSDCQIIG